MLRPVRFCNTSPVCLFICDQQGKKKKKKKVEIKGYIIIRLGLESQLNFILV